MVSKFDDPLRRARAASACSPRPAQQRRRAPCSALRVRTARTATSAARQLVGVDDCAAALPLPFRQDLAHGHVLRRRAYTRPFARRTRAQLAHGRRRGRRRGLGWRATVLRAATTGRPTAGRQPKACILGSQSSDLQSRGRRVSEYTTVLLRLTGPVKRLPDARSARPSIVAGASSAPAPQTV